MTRKKSIIPGFSLNRAIGISSAKQKVARATGIPTTKQGRKRKMQKTVWTAVAVGTAAAISQNGRSDSANDRIQGNSSEIQHQEDRQNQEPTRKPSMLIPGILLLIGLVMFWKGLYLLAILFPILSLFSASKKIKKATTEKAYRVRSFQVLAFLSIFPILGSVITVVLQNMPGGKLPDVQPQQSIEQVHSGASDDLYYTEEEQAEAEEEYCESIGGNPCESESESRIETDGIATYVFHDGDSQSTDSQNNGAENNYILNSNTKKFHRGNCSSVKRINAENRIDFYGKRQSVIDEGYIPCEICNP